MTKHTKQAIIISVIILLVLCLGIGIAIKNQEIKWWYWWWQFNRAETEAGRNLIVQAYEKDNAAPFLIKQLKKTCIVNHFTRIHILIDSRKIDYDKGMKGPGEYYERKSSQQILDSLANHLLESKLFQNSQVDFPADLKSGHDPCFSFSVSFANNVLIKRYVPHFVVYLKDLYPTIKEWLVASHISRKFAKITDRKD